MLIQIKLIRIRNKYYQQKEDNAFLPYERNFFHPRIPRRYTAPFYHTGIRQKQTIKILLNALMIYSVVLASMSQAFDSSNHAECGQSVPFDL